MIEPKPLTTAPLTLEDELQRRRHTNRKRGLDTAWRVANDYISLKKGYPLMVAGKGGVGKTEFILDIMINASIMHGWKWLVLSPEMGDRHEIVEQIIEKLSKGEVLDIPKKHESVNLSRPPMKDETFDKILLWVHKHFRILDPIDNWNETYSNLALNLQHFFEAVDKEESEIGKFDGILIDPFNELDIELNFQSVKDELNVLLAWTKKKNYFTVLTNHTTGNERTIQDITGDGRKFVWTVPATKEEWAYGQQFSRKGYQMILMYEPHELKQIEEVNNNDDYEFLHSHNHGYNVREFYVQKSKPKGVGRTGKFRLFYDKINQRYYEIDKSSHKKDVLWI